MSPLEVVMSDLQGLMNIKKQLSCSMVRQIPSTKSRPIQIGDGIVQTIPYKLKFNIMIRMFPAMLFIVIRF